MNRKEFIKTCGFACLGGTAFASLLQSCIATKVSNGNISGNNLTIPVNEFFIGNNAQKGFKKYIVVHNEQLQYPICIYRLSENEYAALWMQCTHQGAELQVFGDMLQCPAHGSEFSNKGLVLNGPADKSLRTFPVIIENNQLKISLKKI